MAWLKLLVDILTKLDSRTRLGLLCFIVGLVVGVIVTGARLYVKVGDMEVEVSRVSALYLNTAIDDHRSKEQLLEAISVLAKETKRRRHGN